MADSIRQQIIDAFETRLQTIAIADDGYETELGANISQYRTEDWQESDLPGGDIREGEESIEVSGTHHIFTLPLELEVKVSGTASAADVRKVIADVTKAIGVSKFSSFVETIRPLSNGEPDFDKKDKLFGGITMNFEVIYRTGAFDPYSGA